MKPTIPEVIPLLRAYARKEGNGVGGSLHNIMDDGNIEDRHIEFCRQWALDNKDNDAVVLCDLLIQMSKTQRLKLHEMFYHLQKTP